MSARSISLAILPAALVLVLIARALLHDVPRESQPPTVLLATNEVVEYAPPGDTASSARVPAGARTGPAIRGTLSAADGAALPVDGTSLTAKHSSGVARVLAPSETGTYELRGLMPGQWTVRAASRGYYARAVTVDLTDASYTSDVNFALVPARQVVVRFVRASRTGASASLGDVLLAMWNYPYVEIVHESGAVEWVRAAGLTTSHGARIAFESGERATVRTWSGSMRVSEQEFQAVVDELEIPLDLCRIAASLARVELSILHPLGRRSLVRITDEHGEAHDHDVVADGSTVTLDLPPGTHLFRFGGLGCARVERRVELGPAQKLRMEPVALEEGHSVYGWVRDAVGRGLDVQLELSVRTEGDDSPTACSVRLVRSDVNGYFIVSELARGLYTLRVLPEGKPLELEVPVEDGPLLIKADANAREGAEGERRAR